MKATQRKKLATFVKAITFIETHPPILANAPPGFAKQVGTLTTVVATISQLAPDRGSGKPAKAATQRAVLREALRVGQLLPLRAVARVIGKQVAGLPQLVNVKKSAGTQALLDAAKATVRDLTPYEAQFIAEGMPVDFLAQLTARIQAVEAAGQANVVASMARTRARGALKQAFTQGNDALTLADGIIRHLCNADPILGPPTLMTWNTIVSPRGKAYQTVTTVVTGTEGDVTTPPSAIAPEAGAANA